MAVKQVGAVASGSSDAITRSDVPAALAKLLGTDTNGQPVANATGTAPLPVYSKAQADAAAFVQSLIFG